MEYQVFDINGADYKVIWEVVDKFGRVVEEVVSEEYAHGIIIDANKQGVWSVNDRLEEIKEE